jgi:hypothetical protein
MDPPMLRTERLAKRQRLCEQSLSALQAKSPVCLQTLEPEQRWVLFAALQVLTMFEPVPALQRVVGFFLLHCGLSLPAPAVGAALSLGPRSVSALKHTSPEQLLAALRRPPSGPRPKLRPEHVGPLARFLVDNPKATLPQVLRFARSQLGVAVQRHALRRFFRRYSLGFLRQQRVQARPLFAVTPASPAPSSCFERRSA